MRLVSEVRLVGGGQTEFIPAAIMQKAARMAAKGRTIMPYLDRNSTLTRALILGAISGMRSIMGTALISNQIAARHGSALRGTPLAPLANENVARTLSVLSAGEVVADKLPGIPPRIAAGPLIGRALFGALAGAAVCAEEKQPLAAGALVGAVSAVAVTFGMYHLRRWLTKDAGIPDTAVALAEDTIAFSLGRQALSKL